MKRSSLAILPLMLILLTAEKDQPVDVFTDGPYIMYSSNKVYVNYIGVDNGNSVRKVDSMELSRREGMTVKVNTEVPGQTFTVKLKQRLQVEKSEWPRSKKMLVISDLEGNFGAMRKLLTANKVIDQDFNWTFGEGHLVLAGDFVDRGTQQTEVLWLIYSLEQKAKEAGGYVHYILGNHEIMNLSGDLRYLHPKYQMAATLMSRNFVELYGEWSEIGRWLRTKNVAEKIGDMIFVHGGISPSVYRIPFDVPTINKLCRPFYADSTYDYPNLETSILYSDSGPFWYRGFYKGNPETVEPQVDSSLSRFSSRHIVTGHTVVADTVSMFFKGKLFNTDTHHAKGLSEGLLLEEEKFYRVDASGNRYFLTKK